MKINDPLLIGFLVCFGLSMFFVSSRRWNWFITFLIAGFLIGVRLYFKFVGIL